MMDFETCNKARLRRDATFDGRFFTGVKTTGIYCRPVCPARPPLEKNIVFFATAPAAEQAGFRPCLRCRPETAPFCPAWKGTKTTVERALKLIEDGALDQASVTDLAERLGIGPRQLSRLFARHIGASPLQTAKTIRVQKAKRLLNDGELTLSEVAKMAGFSSLRRFHTVFREIYGVSPGKIRRRPTTIDLNP